MPTTHEYEVYLRERLKQLKDLHEDALSTETATSTSLRTDYDALNASIAKSKADISEQTSQLEQTLRLDMNLERQKTTEAYRELERRVGEAVQEGQKKLNKIKMEMGEEGRRVVYGMGAFFGSIILMILFRVKQ